MIVITKEELQKDKLELMAKRDDLLAQLNFTLGGINYIDDKLAEMNGLVKAEPKQEEAK
jgi:hypothetical protein